MTHGSNKVFSLLKIYWLLYLEFLRPYLPPDGKMMDPYFRGNESWEASGIMLTGTRVFLNIHTFTSRAHGGGALDATRTSRLSSVSRVK
jgi:hypothetical protein